jgi:hypothetical protein
MPNALGIFNPPNRNSSIIQITQAIGVLEAVLRQNNVLALAKDPDKHAPAAHRNIDHAAVSARFPNRSISPGATDKIARMAALQLTN